MEKSRYKTILVLVVFLSIIIQSGYMMLVVNQMELRMIAAKAVTTANFEVCVNSLPAFNTTNCPANISENMQVNCLLNGSDKDGDNITFLLDSTETQQVFFLEKNGSVTLKSYIDAIGNYGPLLGNHSIHFWIEDCSGCTNNVSGPYEFNLEVYDVNEPPYQSDTVPNKAILKGADMGLFELDSFFKDPDYGQVLTYNISGNSAILLTIVGTSRVIAYSTVCTTEVVTFRAIDPFGLVVDSNTVEIKVNCDAGGESITTPGSSSGGSGTGGTSEICIPEWTCDPWGECMPDGTQSKRCYDKHVCSGTTSHWYYQNCTYYAPELCEEVWECGEWSACKPDNTKTRTCTDLSNCGTEKTKPETIIACEYVPTCDDGIQNQGETGIDCGGPCLPCKTIETPGPIKEQKTIISSLMLFLSLLVLSLLLVYKYFHKSINVFVIRTLLNFIEKQNKRIFLIDKQAKEILDNLSEIKKTLTNKNVKKKSMEFAYVARKYFSFVMSIKETSDGKVILERIEKMKITEPLSKIFDSFFNKTSSFETEKLKLFKTDMLTVIEEFKEIIKMTSRVELFDHDKEIKEVEIKKTDSHNITIRKLVYNTYIGMHFDKVDMCKEKYSEIIKHYESLPEKQKNEFYDDVARLFNEIRYLSSISQ